MVCTLISAVYNGYASYLQEISRSKCMQLHTEGILRVENSDVIDGLKPNNMYYRSITMAGKVGIDGACKGVQYSDYYRLGTM